MRDLLMLSLAHLVATDRVDGAAFGGCHQMPESDKLALEFDIPDENMAEVLDWSASNATRLFDIGYKSGLRFSEANADKLTFAPVPA
jgi:hypothetical protein